MAVSFELQTEASFRFFINHKIVYMSTATSRVTQRPCFLLLDISIPSATTKFFENTILAKASHFSGLVCIQLTFDAMVFSCLFTNSAVSLGGGSAFNLLLIWSKSAAVDAIAGSIAIVPTDMAA